MSLGLPEASNADEVAMPAVAPLIADNTSVDGLPAAPPAGPDRTELEVVGGFRVHPLASRFPLIVGKDFDDMVESARIARAVTPVELHDGLLIDGRNRVRVVEELRRQGVEIKLPTVEWQPTGDETVEERIFALNVHRRHLSDDQRAALAAYFLPIIRRARRERQEASRFGSREPAAQISSPPDEPAAATRRTSQEKDAASTVGQFAALCDIGLHKARQAIAIADGVAAGTISPTELDAVAAGEKRLRDVARSAGLACKRKRPTKTSDEPAAELIIDATPAGFDEEEVRRRWDKWWDRFKQGYPITEHRAVHRIATQRLKEEQRKFAW